MTYYMVDPGQYVQLINYSGCGNTVNANHPIVKQLIIDSLVHFVEEYHVDGFRFDLASCLCRGKGGTAARVLSGLEQPICRLPCHMISKSSKAWAISPLCYE